jgi:hypothetical protein
MLWMSLKSVQHRRCTLETLLVREPDAMRAVGLKRTKFRAEVGAGRILSVKVGSARLFPVDGLRDYVCRLVSAAEREPDRQSSDRAS